MHGPECLRCVLRTTAAVKSHNATQASVARPSLRNTLDFGLILGHCMFRNLQLLPDFSRSAQSHVDQQNPLRIWALDEPILEQTFGDQALSHLSCFLASGIHENFPGFKVFVAKIKFALNVLQGHYNSQILCFLLP